MVEVVVRLLPHYGPGRVGVTELALDIEAINIKGVFYPVGKRCAAAFGCGLWAPLFGPLGRRRGR